ncbi:cardioacceleratory peptide receptor-like isoform X5 [Anopheles arabiensis]|uniref:cardioacceleratory peptide receptor-like isoform X5 n=1 Tax=Anopheles arabiensis TaxID=7173 RepID=UPI001AAD81FE|nr:cardioacceleratory peptide receptor-like isoform X5 [Anopheles arabiensis]
MLPILTWAYLRHIAVQYHAEAQDPYGSVQLVSANPPLGTEHAGHAGYDCAPLPLFALPRDIDSNSSHLERTIELTFSPAGCRLPPRWAIRNDTFRPFQQSAKLAGGGGLNMRFRDQTDTYTGSAGSSTQIDVIGMNITPALSQTEQFAFLWVLFTVIVLGNSAVLVTLMLNRTRKSRMNFFIKQLAIADLCVGLLNVLTDIIWRITVVWRAGNAACKAIRFVQVCVTYASTYVLVALSIDRYDAITHPMNFSGCWSRARKLVAAAWSFSILFSLPITYFYEERLIQGKMQCWIDLVEAWRWQLYMCWVSGSLFVVPALIISACYAVIVRTIWAKGTILGPIGEVFLLLLFYFALYAVALTIFTTFSIIDRTHNGMADLATRRASSRGIIPRAKVKTVKMTIVIVIVFVLCWSPYIIFDLLQVFGQIPATQTNVAIATFIQSLAPLNSAANPLIYCLFSTQVCRMIKRLPPFRWLWSTKWCCKPHDSGTLPLGNGTTVNGTAHGRFHNHNSSDSMRTLTTSLTVSRRSCLRPARVVIVERPKTELAMSEV